MRAVFEFSRVSATTSTVDREPFNPEAAIDVIACEVFHRVLHPLTTRPFDDKQVEAIIALRTNRSEALQSFKDACRNIATQTGKDLWTDSMSDQIDRLIREKLSRPIREVLELDEAALQDYLDKLLGDPTFLALMIGAVAQLAQLVTGTTIIDLSSAAAGASAVGLLGILAARAYTASRTASKRLESSDLSFVYYANKELGAT